MSGTDQFVYLCNLGNRDIYSNNSPSEFTNRVVPPIQLDPAVDYEVGMINCLYPKQFYSVTQGDYDCRVELWVNAHHSPLHSYLLYTVLPRMDITSGDTNYLVERLHITLEAQLRSALKNDYDRYFERSEFFVYNEKANRFDMIVHKGICFSDDHFCKMSFKLGSKLAQSLGYSERKYVIFTTHPTVTEKTIQVPAPFPPRTDAGVDFAIIYSDLVIPTRYAGENVNILEVLTMEGMGGRALHNIIYKPVNKALIDSISIKVTDQRGRRIVFGEEQTMTAVLHLRPQRK